MTLDAALLDLASHQHGAVAVRQARRIGFSEDALRHRITQGRWERVTSRVLKLVGSPHTSEQALMIASLHHGPDAFLARGTSLAMWGVPGFDIQPREVLTTRLRNARRTPVAFVHTTTFLPETHVAESNGLALTTPIRAIFDIAGSVHPKKVERALDNAWARRLVTYALLHRTLDELAERGRKGIVLMRSLAEARPRSYRPPESNTEARLNDLLEQRGQRRLVPQRDVGSEEAWIGRTDLGDPEIPNFVVEVQSELFHGSKLDRERDLTRRDAMRRAGFVVVEIWESEIWRRPDSAVARVIAARYEARQRLAA